MTRFTVWGLTMEFGWLEDVTRAKRPASLSVVVSRDEVLRLEGTKWIMVSVLYRSGLCLLECLRLLIQDINFRLQANHSMRGQRKKRLRYFIAR
jgi:site-specific recombinase XerD